MRAKRPFQNLREGLQILGTLFVVGMFVVLGFFMWTSEGDQVADSQLHVQLWCEGHAQGIAFAMTNIGYDQPYSNTFQKMVQECKDQGIYLVPYSVQEGVAPPDARTTFIEDMLPPVEVDGTNGFECKNPLAGGQC